jgi:hypothetical protein
MRETISMICFMFILIFISACKPIDSPPEEIDWLSLRGTLIEMTVDEKIELLEPLEMNPGMRHLRIQGLIDMTLDLNYLINDLDDDPVFIQGAPVFLDFLVDYYADQTALNLFHQYLRTSLALTDHEGRLLNTGQYSHLDFILMYYDDYESQYFSHNAFAYMGPNIYSLQDKQRKDYEPELTKSDFELDPVSTLLENLYDFIMENIILFTDYIDVYDVRYGHRLEINFTLEDIVEIDESLLAIVDLENSDIETILTVDVYMAHHTMVLLQTKFDSFFVTLKASLDVNEYFGIFFFDDYQASLMLSLDVFYRLYAEKPRLPEDDYLSLFRNVEEIALPSLDDFQPYTNDNE